MSQGKCGPDVRVVTQLGNQAIGRAMADGNGPGAVLDVAALAAPAIVEACLSRRVHEIEIGAETFVVATLPVDRASTLRGLYGDLAPIAVVRPAARDGEPPVVVDCPGRDFEVAPGDIAAMLGTAADFEAHGVDVRHPVSDDVAPRRASLAVPRDVGRHRRAEGFRSRVLPRRGNRAVPGVDLDACCCG